LDKEYAMITRAKVGRLDLLTRGGRQLVIPTEVAHEVVAGPERDPARLALEGGFGAPFHSTAIDPEVLGCGAWALVNRLFCPLPGPWAPSQFSTTRMRESPRAL
jgi:hypothetical protein